MYITLSAIESGLTDTHTTTSLCVVFCNTFHVSGDSVHREEGKKSPKVDIKSISGIIQNLHFKEFFFPIPSTFRKKKGGGGGDDGEEK